MSTYEIALGEFRGPFHKILDLIEARQLLINEVSLAQVTDDFLKYIQSLEEEKRKEGHGHGIDPRLLADFIGVASSLLLIKSRSLLPDLPLTHEEEEDIKDLEERLALYREFKHIFPLFAAKYKDTNVFVSRSYLAEKSTITFFSPGDQLSLSIIKTSIGKLTHSFESIKKEVKVVREAIVSIEEKIKEIMDRLGNIVSMSFSGLRARRSKSEIVALFLAVLHLAREQIVSLEQDEGFSDIMIQKRQ